MCTYPQTTDGLFLEYSYGVPHSIWTPWGAWIFGSESLQLSEPQVEEVMCHLTATLYIEERFNPDSGRFGPVYAIHAIDGEELPEPKRKDRSQASDDALEVGPMWERLTSDWCKANGVEPSAAPGDKQ